MTKSSQTAPIDTLYSVNTPEGIALKLAPAGPVLRFYAWLVDTLIRTAIIITLAIVLGFMGKTGSGITLILVFLIEWFYPVYFELFHQGKTPGKSIFGLFVAQENASPVTPAASLIRNLLRFVDFLPFAYGFGLVCIMSNKRFQRIGDIVAGTVVLHKDSIQKNANQEDIKPVAPPRPLQLREQQALIQFYQRRHLLSDERAEELAKFSGPLVKEQPVAADYLSGMGRWIMGKR
jgi:uncharacterized RDD family membrane protein YckC